VLILVLVAEVMLVLVGGIGVDIGSGSSIGVGSCIGMLSTLAMVLVLGLVVICVLGLALVFVQCVVYVGSCGGMYMCIAIGTDSVCVVMMCTCW